MIKTEWKYLVTDIRAASYPSLGLWFISCLASNYLEKDHTKVNFPSGIRRERDVRCYILLKFKDHIVQKTTAF